MEVRNYLKKKDDQAKVKLTSYGKWLTFLDVLEQDWFLQQLSSWSQLVWKNFLILVVINWINETLICFSCIVVTEANVLKGVIMRAME